MTDDFRLFSDAAGSSPLDADIELITAYLSGELSPVQIVAVEQRVNKDPDFRRNVMPIIEGWLAMGALEPRSTRSAGERMPTRAAIEAGWQRYISERGLHQETPRQATAHTRASRGDSTHAIHRWRRTLVRIAAAIALVAATLLALGRTTDLLYGLDGPPSETVGDKIRALFDRTTVTATSTEQRELSLSDESTISLSPSSHLVFRPEGKGAGGTGKGIAMSLRGEAVINVSRGTSTVYLGTSVARAVLSPGRYAVRSLKGDSTMTVSVQSGSITVSPRGSSTQQELHAGMSAVVRRNDIVLATATDLSGDQTQLGTLPSGSALPTSPRLANPVPTLTATQELKLAGKKYGFPLFQIVFMRKDGSIVWADHTKANVHLLTRDGAPVGDYVQTPRPDGGMSGVGTVQVVGDSVWVRWGGIMQVFGQLGRPARTFSLAMTVNGPPGSTPKVHTGEGMDNAIVYGLPVGNSLVVEEGYLAMFPSAPKPSPLSVIWLRVSPNGVFESVIGLEHPDEPSCKEEFGTTDARSISVAQPFCPPHIALRPDRTGMTGIHMLPPTGDSTRFELVTLNGLGDTVSRKAYAYPRVPVSASFVDGYFRGLDEKAGDDFAKMRKPSKFKTIEVPPLGLRFGNDGAAWIKIPSNAKGNHWLVLRPDGAIRGLLTLPEGISVIASDDTVVWCTGSPDRQAGTSDLIRFRLSPTL